ncbi:hypothetical protein BDBG_16146 [Blastomyces gilchristii SLH14081]|uniref:Uncharacterized protein n=1 Tax=Blastomyces gilchristii (strain SLH14081) TaxID=559298 RepID=A0A179U9F3_BLAGS|nr:uncharacterized protein BDBG_16146 [Blastomyces gilchristii SLH14081]OAT03929.1 hypothetical protein BDBG_16146 [Blastomyces gilchristii SLH14081]
MLIERGGGIATVMRRAEDRPDADKLVSRRDDISLQDTATISAAVRDAEERENIIIRAVLLQLIDTAVFTFNLAFLMIMKTAAAL